MKTKRMKNCEKEALIKHFKCLSDIKLNTNITTKNFPIKHINTFQNKRDTIMNVTTTNKGNLLQRNNSIHHYT